MARNKCVTFVGTLMLLSNIYVSYAAIHHQMTKDELKSTFHVDDHKLVPEYEIIDIHHVKEEEMKFGKLINSVNGVSNKKINLKAFGKEMNLTLTLNDELIDKDNFKIWSMELNSTAKNGIQYVDETSKINFEEFGELYQDEVNQAAILLKSHKNSLIVEGSIGSELEIRPIPERLLEITAVDENSSFRQKYIAYKKNIDYSKYDLNHDYEFVISNNYLNFNQNNKNLKGQSQVPNEIYPKLLLLIDPETYKLHNKNENELFNYLRQFWNKVGVLYKLVTQPRITLTIVDVVVSKDYSTASYLKNNLLEKKNTIDGYKTLEDMYKYLFNENKTNTPFLIGSYNIAFLMTKLDLCIVMNSTTFCGLLGRAGVGTACLVDAIEKEVRAAGEIEDSGKYNGVFTAAHELAHLLGARHDGYGTSSNCSPDDFHIMSPKLSDESKHTWSKCTIQAFQSFAASTYAECLLTKPTKRKF